MNKTGTPPAWKRPPEPECAKPGKAEVVEWVCRDRTLRVGAAPLVMGILNVTPDSFSDGGRYLGKEAAIRRGLQMAEEGADILDIGGESTRPGSASVDAREERRRVLPVLEAIRREIDVCLSIDTCKAEVARAAFDSGVEIINDVTAFTGDDAMAKVVRLSGAGAVLMHMQGTPRTMQANPRYDNVVEDVTAYLASRVASLAEQGVEKERLAVDPGIGFGKTLTHNLKLLACLPKICSLGRPVVVGLSRKSFLGKLTGREPEDRLAGSLAALVFSVMRGAHVMRVHDVKESVDAIRTVTALAEAGKGEPFGAE